MNRRADVAPTTGNAPFSIERAVLFPITRLLFLSGDLVEGVGVLVFGVLATYSTFTPPPTTVVSVSISDLTPVAMGETPASINVQHDILVAAPAAFRNSSALLPEGERVEYVNTFKKENGRWKLYLIVSEMRVVEK